MALRILLVDDEAERAQLVTETLGAAGHTVLVGRSTSTPLIDQVRAADPDVVIVAMELPDRDALEQMRTIGQDDPKPIVMFVGRSDRETMLEAIKAGVAAYVIDGIDPHRVRDIVDVAVAQFREFQALRSQLTEARASLADRKLIERAKGILMSRRQCSEEEAYGELRKMAMSRGQKLAEIAENIIAVAALLA